MKSATLSGILAFSLAFCNAQAAPLKLDAARTDPVALKQVVKSGWQKTGARAVLLGVWQGDQEVVTLAMGDSMTSTPATTDMHYRLGGISETFQATLLLQLVDQKVLGLNDKIVKWFPDLLAADQVTVKMLLNNSAGYKDYVRDPDFEKLVLAEPFRQLTPTELIQFAVKDGQLDYPPGTSQAYSHTDYVILGEVMERASGKSMAQLYQENIFTPLSLKETQFPPNPEILPPVLHAFSSDRGIYEDSTYWNPSWTSHTGALTSSLKDLGRWGPSFGNGALLSKESFQVLVDPGTVGLGKNTPALYFAGGFVVANGWYAQNPNFNGFQGAFGFLPSQNLTVVVAATQGPGADSSKNHAFEIFREVTRYLTPDTPINF